MAVSSEVKWTFRQIFCLIPIRSFLFQEWQTTLQKGPEVGQNANLFALSVVHSTPKCRRYLLEM